MSVLCLPFIEWRQRFQRRQQAYRAIQQPTSVEEPFLDPPRKRNLTLPGIDYQEQQQMSCPFFDSIPLEIRIIIYQEIFGDESLHIRSPDRHFQHCLRRVDRNFAQGSLHQCLPVSQHKAQTNLPPWTSTKDGDLLSILLTCHQAYSEAIDLLYSTRTLVMTQPGTLILLHKLILPQRLHAVRSLRLHWWLCGLPPSSPIQVQDCLLDWTNVCSVLATMEGLRDLCIELAMTEVWKFHPLIFGARVLKPLQAVAQPKDFELRMPFTESVATVDIAEMPYRMKFYSNLELDEICQFRYPQRCIIV